MITKEKYIIHACTYNTLEDAIRADQYSKSLLDKDMVSFWRHIRKSNNVRVPLASTAQCAQIAILRKKV